MCSHFWVVVLGHKVELSQNLVVLVASVARKPKFVLMEMRQLFDSVCDTQDGTIQLLCDVLVHALFDVDRHGTRTLVQNGEQRSMVDESCDGNALTKRKLVLCFHA